MGQEGAGGLSEHLCLALASWSQEKAFGDGGRFLAQDLRLAPVLDPNHPTPRHAENRDHAATDPQAVSKLSRAHAGGGLCSPVQQWAPQPAPCLPGLPRETCDKCEASTAWPRGHLSPKAPWLHARRGRACACAQDASCTSGWGTGPLLRAGVGWADETPVLGGR